MSAAQSPGGLRVDFYIVAEASGTARLTVACRLAEKAYLAGHSVLVWHSSPEELREFDALLWTFTDRAFVPHEPLMPGTPADAPVLLSAGVTPPGPVDVIINLAAELPPCLTLAKRVAEIVDGDAARRQAGRARFKAYREMGIEPSSHNLGD